MRQLYKHHDDIYIVLRQVSLHNFKNIEQVKEYKDYIQADHVLKTPTHYLFCENVESIDFTIIEDIQTKTIV